MLDLEDRKKILAYARELLEARLTGGPEPKLELRHEVMEQKCGIFVTLKLRGRLRGCIGHILGDEPFRKSIREMTLAAAFEDLRFPSLSWNELKDLKIHISLLTGPRPIKSYEDIRIGTDGIIVAHKWKKGVYLPEVATETGWNPKTFFESCAFEKAGLVKQELPDATIRVFQTEGFED